MSRSDLFKKRSSYRADCTPGIAFNPSSNWVGHNRTPAETVAFLGDHETPGPLFLEVPATPSTSGTERYKKLTATVSESSARISCDEGNMSAILMGQTFQSLVDKDIPDFVSILVLTLDSHQYSHV
jgi:hypothetical protein